MIVGGEGRLRRIDIEASPKPKIIGAIGIIGHSFAARRRVGRDEDEAEFSAEAAIFALFRDICMGAGQTRQIPDHRQFRA